MCVCARNVRQVERDKKTQRTTFQAGARGLWVDGKKTTRCAHDRHNLHIFATQRYTYIAQELLRLNTLALEVLTKDTLVRELRLQLVRVLLQNQRSAPLLS